MSLKEFRKLIRKYIEEELNEASVTANIDGGEGPPKTPYAFRKKKDEEDESGFQDGHVNPETGTTYEKVKKHEHNVFGVKTKKYKPLGEGRYHDFRNDDTKTPKQKIGMAMRETRDSLTELERIVKMNVKLKTELNIDSRSYWKNTHKALSKISERLVKLANKVGQLQ